MLDIRVERRVGFVGASSSDSFSGSFSETSFTASLPSFSSSWPGAEPGSGPGFSSSGESEVPSVLSLTGRVDGGLGTLRFVRDLAELVSTASSKVSYGREGKTCKQRL